MEGLELELLRWMETGAGHLPELAAGLLLWKTKMLILSIVIFSAIAGVSGFGLWKTFKNVKAEKYMDHDDKFIQYICGGFGFAMSLIIILINAIDLSMIVNHPDLYLLEYVMNHLG